MEKRKHSRVPFHITAFIILDKEYKVNVENISMKGMLIDSEKEFINDSIVDIKILLAETSNEYESITIKGKIIRKDKESEKTGIVFHEMDLDSFTLLRELVSSNDGDPEKILKEITDSSI
ncbi:MAG: PilZ domain-containing protein [Spirochaetia bacterium]|nr:PilZ domain-containing protein [Spirochaetia bacterium]